MNKQGRSRRTCIAVLLTVETFPDDLVTRHSWARRENEANNKPSAPHATQLLYTVIFPSWCYGGDITRVLPLSHPVFYIKTLHVYITTILGAMWVTTN